MPRKTAALQLLAALPFLVACPTGEVVPHPPCTGGLVLVGQGASEHCAAADAGGGGDAAPGADAAADAATDAATDAGRTEPDATVPDADTPDAPVSCDERCPDPWVCEDEVCLPCSPSPGPVDPGCDDATPQCDDRSDPRVCRQCLSGAHCQDPLAARCEDGACVPCEGPGDCLDHGARDRCDAGACVECTVATEEVDCGPSSCDPATRACTQTPRGSRLICQSCVADSECEDAHHCVPMDFQGVRRPQMYCLPDRNVDCPRNIYVAPYDSVTSASGDNVNVCGPDGDLTTCEAVRDMRAGTDCNEASDCGDAQIDTDGVCNALTCTIPCGTDPECPQGQSCGAGDFCVR